MAFIDFYGDFLRGKQTCSKCGWVDLGSAMDSGNRFGDGVEKDCPHCGRRWGFVQ
jgi:hypothetical protein